jgi:hypothetical protein
LETKFARLEYVADNRFNMSYMRHTDQGSAHKLGTGRYYCVPELKVVDGSVGGILAKPGQF